MPICRYPLFILAFVLLGYQAACQTERAYVDFQDDEDYPAKNVELLINIKGDSIGAYAFIAKGEQLKETIILTHGYPGYDNNFDIAQAIRRTGKNVISFNYRGSWGNQGEHLYSNSIEDVAEVIAFLSKPDQTSILRIDTSAFSIIGRSYGAGVALIAGSRHPQVQKIIAISSTNYGYIMERHDNLSALGGFKKYMNKQVMINHNIEKFLQELLDHKKEFNIISYKNQLQSKKVLLIEDSKKNMDWIQELENIELIHIPSNHGFIDKRIELTSTIIDWLNEN